MRPEVRHLIMKRMKNDFVDNASYDNARNDMTYGNTDMTGRDMAYRDGYSAGFEDGRRGVRGSGRRDRESGSDFDDDDFEKRLKLPNKVRMHWLNNLRDKDGHRGPRFSKEEVMEVADKMQIEYENYTPADICLIANVLYSDLTVFRPLMQKDKEVYYFVGAAKEWLEDDDSSLTGSDKVVSYYYNVVKG